MRRLRLEAALAFAFGIASQSLFAAEPAPTRAPAVVSVRGMSSLVTQINLGPEGSGIWRQIQHVVADPDLSDFEDLRRRFDLAMPAGSPADASRKEVQINELLPLTPGQPLARARYGVFRSSGADPLWFVSFTLHFDLRQFCLPKMEIERVYGKGHENAPTHAPNVMMRDHTGYQHTMSLAPPARGGFTILGSGCAESFSISQPLGK